MGIIVAKLCAILLILLQALNKSGAASLSRTTRETSGTDLEDLASTVAEYGVAIEKIMQQLDAVVRQFNETPHLWNEVGELKISDLGATLKVTTTGGVTYTRWGRTTCDTVGTRPLYKGFAATSKYDHRGGGANFLCLHEQPQWGVYFTGGQSSSSIYGVQYELSASTGSPFSTRNNQNLSLDNNDAPCVVCHNVLRSNQLMIPGRRSCPLGWTAEYLGYLASAYDHHASRFKSSYICLDEAPEAIPGGYTSGSGALLYSVEAGCGSLPCPKYVEGYEVACVVCAK